LGIGIATPSEKLEVSGDILATGGDIFLISNKNGINVNQDTGTLMKFRLAEQDIAELSRVGNNNGQLRLPQYSSGNTADNYPAYSFTSDTDSGLVSFGANSVGLVTGGDTKLIVDSSGNVGIGDTTPDATLDVAGSFRLDGTFGDKDGDVGTAGQILSSTGTGTD